MSIAALTATVLGVVAPAPPLADERFCTAIADCDSSVALVFRSLPMRARRGNGRVTLCTRSRCIARRIPKRYGIRLIDSNLRGPGQTKITVVLRNASGHVVWRRVRTVRLTGGRRTVPAVGFRPRAGAPASRSTAPTSG